MNVPVHFGTYTPPTTRCTAEDPGSPAWETTTLHFRWRGGYGSSSTPRPDVLLHSGSTRGRARRAIPTLCVATVRTTSTSDRLPSPQGGPWTPLSLTSFPTSGLEEGRRTSHRPTGSVPGRTTPVPGSWETPSMVYVDTKQRQFGHCVGSRNRSPLGSSDGSSSF